MIQPLLPEKNELSEGMLFEKFDEMYVKWNESKGTREGLHASSVLQDEAEFCFREHILALDFLPSPRQIPVKTLRKFWHGWILHEKWQALFNEEMSEEQFVDWMKRFSTVFEPNAEEMEAFYAFVHHDMVEKEKWRKLFAQQKRMALEVETSHYARQWGLSFTPDAIIHLFGQPFIVEIKGYRASAYEHMMEIEDYMDDADFKKAALQANLYMHLLKINRGIILIENKNTQEYFLSLREYSEELVAPYIERLDLLRTLSYVYRSRGVFPKRKLVCVDAQASRARNCPMREACFAKKEEREALRR